MSLDDAATVGAIIAPGIAEEGRAENWFRLVSECYHDSVEDNGGQVPGWDTYWGSLSGKATDLGGAERDEFERYMKSVMAPMEIIGDLAGDSRGSAVSAVLTKYLENRPQEAAEEASEEPFDEAWWGAYLTKWTGGWDGTEATWPDFAQGIRYWAGEEPVGATELSRRVEELVSHAEGQDLTARTEFLTAYGIVAAAAEEPFDEAWWGAYLTKWAGGWDGTDATWPDFAQGIRYWAGEEPAGATELSRRVEELLSHAEGQDITGRAEFLTAYGIVASTGVATGQASEVDTELVAALAETTATSEIVQTLFEETIVPGLTEAIEAVPGASELSVEEIQEILAEVLEEQLAAASGTAGA
ncbi:hypothetical protein ACFWN2_03945 [Lentzea sp. NPDC058436]|uniref:hypothetical protein n=1 Tax=Lentzea sp. NPDC058436 TaxID=3346499 RepID=UPI0036626CDE